jgi:hypothetical protein
LDNVDRYREHAEAMRRAAGAASGELRADMIRLAVAWDTLADDTLRSRLPAVVPRS